MKLCVRVCVFVHACACVLGGLLSEAEQLTFVMAGGKKRIVNVSETWEGKDLQHSVFYLDSSFLLQTGIYLCLVIKKKKKILSR